MDSYSLYSWTHQPYSFPPASQIQREHLFSFKVSLALRNIVYLISLLEHSRTWQSSESQFGFYFGGERIIYYKEFQVEYQELLHSVISCPKFLHVEYCKVGNPEWAECFIRILKILNSHLLHGSLKSRQTDSHDN